MSKVRTKTSTVGPWTLTTERIVIAGVLAAITMVLGYIPNIGFIPIPTIAGHATIEHIPTILGGIVAGPIVGLISGLIFGIVSLTNPLATPIFRDPLISVLPRIFIGLVAWGTFTGLVRINRDFAAGVAGFAGAATNTILVLTMIVVRTHAPLVALVPIIPQAIIEAIIAAILTILLVRVFFILEARLVRAPETKPRDELPY
ncbi:MAG: hypothetical protein NVS4B11_14370 [Ktedonobacteraceae bacterium]